MKFLYLSLFAVAFFATNLLWADDDPAIKIKETSEKLLDILYSDSQNIERDSLAYLSDRYNLDIIIRRTLGRNWNKINANDKDRITKLIKQIVLRAFIDGMRGKSKPRLKFSDTQYITQKRAEVSTIIHFLDKSIVLNYRLGLVSNKWEIFDIVVENISLVLTYRSQFDTFFAKYSSDDLIDKLEKLLINENLGKAFPL